MGKSIIDILGPIDSDLIHQRLPSHGLYRGLLFVGKLLTFDTVQMHVNRAYRAAEAHAHELMACSDTPQHLRDYLKIKSNL